MKTNYFLLLILAAMTTGCSENDTEAIAPPAAPDHSAPIHLSAGILTKTQAKAAVAGETFPVSTDDVFRVTAFAGSAAPTSWETPYFKDKAVNSGSSSALSFATAQYYPTNSDKLYFYACTPGGTLTDGTASAAPVVSYTLTGQEDIMAAQHTTGIAKSASQTHPSFSFTHKLKQVKFKLKADASFESDIQVTEIKVKDAKTTGKLTLSDGTLAFESPVGDLSLPITPGTNDKITTAGTTMDGCILFEPGINFTISITAGSVTYDNVAIGLTGTNAGEAGVSHLVTLTFKRGGIGVTADITDWKPGEGVDVDVQ